MAKRRDKTGLDAREEAFAAAYVKCRNARIAYEAYKPGSTAEAESKRVAGYRLLSLAHISLRIEQLRQIAIENSVTTVDTILREIDEARELAMHLEQPGVARAASLDKAKLAGFLKPEDKLNLGGVNVTVVLGPDDVALG
jgi:hypothetical protein